MRQRITTATGAHHPIMLGMARLRSSAALPFWILAWPFVPQPAVVRPSDLSQRIVHVSPGAHSLSGAKSSSSPQPAERPIDRLTILDYPIRLHNYLYHHCLSSCKRIFAQTDALFNILADHCHRAVYTSSSFTSSVPSTLWLRPCSTSSSSSRPGKTSGTAMHTSQRISARNFGYRPPRSPPTMSSAPRTHRQLNKHHDRCLLHRT